MHRVLHSAPGYAVNILRADQEDVARRFSAAAETNRFAGLATIPGRYGIPLLAEAVASIECDHSRIVDGGDHSIMIGAVSAMVVAGGAPLLYVHGRVFDPT
jgi:flavin reductase (DIM6/NTAB) family NADH-FMN oxidoreductase RutF